MAKKLVLFGLSLFLTINAYAVDVSGMSSEEIKKHNTCLKLSQSPTYKNSPDRIWEFGPKRTGCESKDFYPEFEAALAEQARLDKEKKEQEQLAKENALKEQIAQQKAEQLATAQEHGFSSYEAYQADVQRKEQEEKEKIAKSKGYDSHEDYMAAVRKQERENLAKEYPYQAIIGCGEIEGRVLPVAWCINSFKVNGRFSFSNSVDMQRKHGNPETIKINLPKSFQAMLEPANGRLYYLQIIDTVTEKELFYEEKQDKYSVIKVKS